MYRPSKHAVAIDRSITNTYTELCTVPIICKHSQKRTGLWTVYCNDKERWSAKPHRQNKEYYEKLLKEKMCIFVWS